MTGATNISYNGNSLQGVVSSTFQIITSDIDHFSNPDKSAKMYPLSHANKSVLPFIAYPSKIIKVSGYLVDVDIPHLDADLDTFKGWFGAVQDAALVIDYNGGSRTYTATASKVQITRPVGLAYAKFSIEFECSLPWGTGSNSTLVNSSGNTTASETFNATFTGNAPIQEPIITVTLTAVSDTAGGYIFVGNNANGQGITTNNRVWSAGDVLVIDCTQKTVTVNGAPLGFSGAFPQFATGAQVLAYLDNFTSRTLTMNVTQTPYYL